MLTSEKKLELERQARQTKDKHEHTRSNLPEN